MNVITKPKHPAKYTDSLLPVFERMLAGCKNVLDPFAGTGKIHSLPFETVGVEIEKEWAEMHEKTIIGDATDLQFANLMLFAQAQHTEIEWQIATKQKTKAHETHIPTN